MRRFIAALAIFALAFTVGATVASAHHGTITVTTECRANDLAGWNAYWKLGNSESLATKPMTITNNSSYGFSPNPVPPSGFGYVTKTYPMNQTSAMITVQLSWPNGATDTQTQKVDRPAGCFVTTTTRPTTTTVPSTTTTVATTTTTVPPTTTTTVAPTATTVATTTTVPPTTTTVVTTTTVATTTTVPTTTTVATTTTEPPTTTTTVAPTTTTEAPVVTTTTVESPPEPTGDLPFTGGNSLGVAAFGLFLVGAGGLMVWLNRKKR